MTVYKQIADKLDLCQENKEIVCKPTAFINHHSVNEPVDVVLVDTAGRLHNKQNLMNELNKISRVVDRELPGCDRETLLVLDATTGQNG